MSLLSKWIESLDYDYEVLPACSRHMSSRSKCEECVISCPAQAISIKKGKPSFNQSKCTDCGHCISACPVQAIAGIYPRRTIMRGHLVINNEKLPTWKELLILYKKGIRNIICDDPSLLEKWMNIIEEANEILNKLQEEPIKVSLKSFKKDESLSRRELFLFWKNESKSVVKQVAPAKWRFNHDDFHLPKYYKEFQFFKMHLDLEKCLLCGACEKLCKNQCIKIDENVFTINMQNCTGCQLCVDSCPEQALQTEKNISKAEEQKYTARKQVCQSCKQTFLSLSESNLTCAPCQTRKRIFQSV